MIMNKKFSCRALAQTLVMVSLTIITNASYALTDMNGKSTTIEAHTAKGQWSVVTIWASTCTICHQSIGEIETFKKRFPQAKVLGVSTDGSLGKAEAQGFIKQLGLSFPNLLGSYMEVSDYIYRHAGESLMGTPTLLLYNPQGKLLAVQPGPVSANELIGFIQKQTPETK